MFQRSSFGDALRLRAAECPAASRRAAGWSRCAPRARRRSRPPAPTRPRGARRPTSGPGCPSAWRLSCASPSSRARRASSHRPGERLLHVDVLLRGPAPPSRRGVQVIGRGDDDRVDVLLLVEHLAEVACSASCRGRSSAMSFFERLDAMLRCSCAPVRSVTFGSRSCSRFRSASSDVPRLAGIAPVDVAERDDVVAEREVEEVDLAHAADADAGDVEPVARRASGPRPSTCRGTMVRPAPVVPTVRDEVAPGNHRGSSRCRCRRGCYYNRRRRSRYGAGRPGRPWHEDARRLDWRLSESCTPDHVRPDSAAPSRPSCP